MEPWQQAPIVGTPETGWQAAPVLTNPRPTVPQYSRARDIGKSIETGAGGAAIGVLGFPGSVAAGAGDLAGAAGGWLGMKPEEQPAFADQFRRAIPVLGGMPTIGEVADTVKFKPYQPQSQEGYLARNVTGGAVTGGMIAATGGTSIPLGSLYGAGGGVGATVGGNVAASQFGEPARPYGELGGGAVGSVLPSMGTRAVANSLLKARAPTTASVFAKGSALFDAARAEGITIKPDVMDRLLQRVIDIGKAKGADPGIEGTKDAWGVIQRFEKEMSGGPVAPGLQPPGKAFDDVMTLRQIVREAQGEHGGAAASAMKAAFDDAINSLGAGDVIGPDPARAVSFLNQAREVWQQASKARDIDDIFRKAEPLSARLDKPGAHEEAIRKGFARLEADENFTKFWTPDEQAAIKAAARGGGPAAQLMRRIGQSKAVDLFGVIPFNPLRGAGNTVSRGVADVAKATVLSGRPAISPTKLPTTVQGLAAALSGDRSRQELLGQPALNLQWSP